MLTTHISLQLFGFLSSLSVGAYTRKRSRFCLSRHIEPIITCQNICVSLHHNCTSCRRCGLAGHHFSLHVEAADHQYMLKTHERR